MTGIGSNRTYEQVFTFMIDFVSPSGEVLKRGGPWPVRWQYTADQVETFTNDAGESLKYVTVDCVFGKGEAIHQFPVPIEGPPRTFTVRRQLDWQTKDSKLSFAGGEHPDGKLIERTCTLPERVELSVCGELVGRAEMSAYGELISR